MSLRINRRKDEAPYYLDLSMPNHTQLSTAVKGRDVLHDDRMKRRSFFRQQLGYALVVLGLLVLTFAALFVIAEAVR